VAPPGYASWTASRVADIMYLGGVDVSGTGTGAARFGHLSGRSGIHLAGTGNTVRQVTVEDQGWNWTNNEASISPAPTSASGELHDSENRRGALPTVHSRTSTT